MEWWPTRAAALAVRQSLPAMRGRFGRAWPLRLSKTGVPGFGPELLIYVRELDLVCSGGGCMLPCPWLSSSMLLDRGHAGWCWWCLGVATHGQVLGMVLAGVEPGGVFDRLFFRLSTYYGTLS